MVESQVVQVRELEKLVDSLERRESILIAELVRTRPLPAKHIQAGGKVIRE